MSIKQDTQEAAVVWGAFHLIVVVLRNRYVPIRSKFAEISAAYELLLNRGSDQGSSSASHLPFASRRPSACVASACAQKLASFNKAKSQSH